MASTYRRAGYAAPATVWAPFSGLPPAVAPDPDARDGLVDRLRRLASELRTARAQTARWQRHADAYARERDSLARERAYLLAWLAALHPSSAVVAAPAPDGTAGDRHLLSLVAGGRSLSWALAPEDVSLFRHVRQAGETATRAWRDPRGSRRSTRTFTAIPACWPWSMMWPEPSRSFAPATDAPGN
ncbi:hypothetical protein [Streptomyces sp. NPDC006285]|uniref:hypothetical protein n=1 Tax=Streptomyces sp. NPDC006285 TaxID=3364742 RepID=UPI0036781E2A